ncbi:MAG: NUDIX domain-containing protein [Thaumarchaeota archaeon]|nr:NUDIX domain-containing protein [Nitrososphaerota archaeon]
MKLVGSQPFGPVGGLVPESVFAEHERLFPQVSIDIIVLRGRSFLLVRRSSKNSTGRGLWATVGGRLRMNETLEDGAVRILDREAGITADKSCLEVVGVSQYFDKEVHCVSVVFKTKVLSRSVVLDETSSESGWFTRESCPASLIPFYRKMLRLGGLDIGPYGRSEE